MKTLKVIFFFSFLLSSLSLFASPYDMILAEDPIIEDLRYVALESGQSIVSFSAPFPPHEIKMFLDRIDESLLSAPAREAYNRIVDRLNPKTKLSLSWEYFSLFFNVNSTLEARIRTNTAVDWYPVYPKIPAFLSLPLRFHFANTVQFFIDPSVNIDPYNYASNKNFTINTPFEGINGNSPLRAFIAAGGPWWNFQLGRDRLSYGTGLSGNIGIADNPPFYEFMRLSFFSKYFKYSLLINQTPLKFGQGELYTFEDPNSERLEMTMQRYFYTHRIDFTLFKVLSIGLMEGVVVGNSSLELRHLNPLTIFHNMMTWRDYDDWPESGEHRGGQGFMNGSFFTAEINWSITRSLAAYGQFVMNELAVLNETAPGKHEAPNGLGFMGGLQYSHSFDTWASLFFLECIYTYPYLYMNASPYASFIFMHNVEFVHAGQYYYYFGYPRDTLALTAGTRFFNGDKLIINGTFSWISRGKHGGHPIEWDWERTEDAFKERTPSGTPENNFIVSVGAEYKAFRYFTLKGNLTGIFVTNNKHQDSNETGLQAAVSVSFSY